MTKGELIAFLNEEMEMWARILGKFNEGSYWFRRATKKIHAFREIIERLEDIQDEGQTEEVQE